MHAALYYTFITACYSMGISACASCCTTITAVYSSATSKLKLLRCTASYAIVCVVECACWCLEVCAHCKCRLATRDSGPTLHGSCIHCCASHSLATEALQVQTCLQACDGSIAVQPMWLHCRVCSNFGCDDHQTCVHPVG